MCENKGVQGTPTKNARKECPTCNGQKTIPGVCTCDTEWRGNQQGDKWDDCQCTPAQVCPLCHGTGLAASA